MFPEFPKHFAQGDNQSLRMFERADSQAHATIAGWISVPIADQDSVGAQRLNEFRVGRTDTCQHEVGAARPLALAKSFELLLQ
jgi:hypothetical protein